MLLFFEQGRFTKEFGFDDAFNCKTQHDLDAALKRSVENMHINYLKEINETISNFPFSNGNCAIH